MEQKKVTIEALLEKGKVNGKLSEKEITDVMEDLDFDLDQFLSRCEQLNIEIINDSSMDTASRDSDISLNADDLELSLSTEASPLTTPSRSISRRSAVFPCCPWTRKNSWQSAWHRATAVPRSVCARQTSVWWSALPRNMWTWHAVSGSDPGGNLGLLKAWRSSTTTRGSSSLLMPLGGFGRPSPVPLPIRKNHPHSGTHGGNHHPCQESNQPAASRNRS